MFLFVMKNLHADVWPMKHLLHKNNCTWEPSQPGAKTHRFLCVGLYCSESMNYEPVFQSTEFH